MAATHTNTPSTHCGLRPSSLRPCGLWPCVPAGYGLMALQVMALCPCGFWPCIGLARDSAVSTLIHTCIYHRCLLRGGCFMYPVTVWSPRPVNPKRNQNTCISEDMSGRPRWGPRVRQYEAPLKLTVNQHPFG